MNDEDLVDEEAAQDDNDSYVDILAVPENNPIFASPEKDKQNGKYEPSTKWYALFW